MENSIKEDILKVYNSNFKVANTSPIFISFNNFLSIFGKDVSINYYNVLNYLYPLNNFNDKDYKSVDITSFYAKNENNLVLYSFSNEYEKDTFKDRFLTDIKTILMHPQEFLYSFNSVELLKVLFNSLKNNLEFIEHFGRKMLKDLDEYIIFDDLRDKFKIRIYEDESGRLNMILDIDDDINENELTQINQIMKMYHVLKFNSITDIETDLHVDFDINLYNILNDLDILKNGELFNIEKMASYEEFTLFNVKYSKRLKLIFTNNKIEQVNHLENFTDNENITTISEIKLEREDD